MDEYKLLNRINFKFLLIDLENEFNDYKIIENYTTIDILRSFSKIKLIILEKSEKIVESPPQKREQLVVFQKPESKQEDEYKENKNNQNKKFVAPYKNEQKMKDEKKTEKEKVIDEKLKGFDPKVKEKNK